MRYFYIDRDRLALRQPCIAVRNNDGDVEYVDEITGFGHFRMRAPHGEPLTPTGPAAWVEARILTVGHMRLLVALGCVTFWVAVGLAITHWMAR